MGMTDDVANASLDNLLGNASGPLGATVYIGLLLATPNSNGTGVSEPTGGGYVRKAVTNNATEWPAASGRAKSHANDIIWSAATADWGEITHVGIFDAATGGNLKLVGVLTPSRTVYNTDVVKILASSPMQFTLPWEL